MRKKGKDHYSMSIAFCVLDTETPTHLQVMDDGVAAQYANKSTIFYYGQLVHIATSH